MHVSVRRTSSIRRKTRSSGEDAGHVGGISTTSSLLRSFRELRPCEAQSEPVCDRKPVREWDLCWTVLLETSDSDSLCGRIKPLGRINNAGRGPSRGQAEQVVSRVWFLCCQKVMGSISQTGSRGGSLIGNLVRPPREARLTAQQI